MTEVIPQIANKYIIAKEDDYGSVPDSPTKLDMGYIQTVSVDVDDSVEEINAINTEHTVARLDEDIHNVSGSITTKLTKESIYNLSEALLGVIEDDAPSAGEYRATTDYITSDDLSYFMKYKDTEGNVKVISGIHFTDGDATISRDGSIEMTINFRAQKKEIDSETLDPITPTGRTFRGLDVSVEIDGNSTILREFSFTIDWNISDDDMRGIEASDDRRTINRVLRNNMTVSGSFESYLDENIDKGYEDNPGSFNIEVTIDRESDNNHIIVVEDAKITTISEELTTDDEARVFSADYTAKDIEIIGDLYSSS